MSVDSLDKIAPTQEANLNYDSDRRRKIKDPVKTEDNGLDTKRQKISNKETHRTVLKDGDIEMQIYDDKGTLVRKVPAEYPLKFRQRLIDKVPD